jgi:serine phosphatase RsbU (regulator of sigma subunit)
LTTALAGATSASDVARTLAEDGANAAGASFSNVALLNYETDRVQVVHRSTIDSDLAARWSEFDLDASTPLGAAILTGLPILLESLLETSERFPHVVDATVEASLSATASLPLVTPGGDILGAAGFGWATPQSFEPGQLHTLNLITRMSAQALLHQRKNEEQRVASRDRADAQLLQDAFLPRELPHTETLDVAARYLPAAHAALGGDWYDVFPVDGGICLVIGDVVGHGLAAAAVMGQLRNAIRAYAIEDPSPARVLTRLNHMMCRLEQGHFATAIVALWDEHTGTLLRANAGHPPMLRCRSGEFGYLFSPQGDRLLGVTPKWEYQEETKVLRPGTTLLFYTDGLIEWRERPCDRAMDELVAITEQFDDLSPQGVCDQVVNWRHRRARQEDDVCVLAVRLK